MALINIICLLFIILSFCYKFIFVAIVGGALLQNKLSNYPIINEIQKKTNFKIPINVYGLDKNRMYATYFGGDKNQGLEADEEAKQIWLKYLPPSRVLPFDMKDNFWEMGETGPCGPCTEIHYDRLDNGRDAANLVNMDDPTVIEIWNLVFIQYNRNEDQSLQLLPNKHVDTGMGFERITSILQNKSSNYDIDVLMPAINEFQKKTNCKGKVGKEDTMGYDIVRGIIEEEELSFSRTLKQGRKRFEKKVEELKKRGKTEIDGKTACILYSTFGFPLYLTKLMVVEKGMTVTEAEYEAEMEKVGDIAFIDFYGNNDDNKTSDPESAFKVNALRKLNGFIVHIDKETKGPISMKFNNKSNEDHAEVRLSYDHTMLSLYISDELSKDFEEALVLDGGMELSSKCLELSRKVEKARIGAVEKIKLREEVEVLTNKDKAYKKDLGKQRKKKVVDIVSKINTDIESGNFIIRRIDDGLDKKALKGKGETTVEVEGTMSIVDVIDVASKYINYKL